MKTRRALVSTAIFGCIGFVGCGSGTGSDLDFTTSAGDSLPPTGGEPGGTEGDSGDDPDTDGGESGQATGGGTGGSTGGDTGGATGDSGAAETGTSGAVGTGGSGDTTTSGGSADPGESDGDLRFDVGVGSATAGADGGESAGCNKVDFLFVIDNSQSMADDQQRLIAAFPEFIDGIQNTITANDFHIGVITTDDHVYDYDTYYNGQPRTECDVLGGLVTENWDYTTNTQRFCGPFAGGANYMTHLDADLVDKFSCAAFVDDEGSTDEKPMAAITAAVTQPSISCNQGFLRDDALLVIVLITDEEDDLESGGNPGSPGDPADWYTAVMEAKGNDPSRAVVLALAGTPQCTYERTLRIEQWVDMFGVNGFVGPVCVDDYGGFFKDSIMVVDEACDGFIPPG